MTSFHSGKEGEEKICFDFQGLTWVTGGERVVENFGMTSFMDDPLGIIKIRRSSLKNILFM